MSTPTQTEVAAKSHRRAIRFFWRLLILGTVTSLYGNIAHAVDASGAVNPSTIIGASIAPIFLMALVHGLAHLARNTASSLAYALVVALVGGVAVFAFAQSYGALTAFARDAKVLAPGLTPLIVDATIAVSTFALVVLGDKPTRRSSGARSAGTTSASHCRRGGTAATATAAESRTATPNRVVAPTGARRRTEPATPDEVSRRDLTGFDAADLAVALVESKVTRQPVEVVRAVLEAHDDGVVLNRIAKDVGVHHTAVRRIIDTATAHRQRDLAAAS
jgi:hypothetical protein